MDGDGLSPPAKIDAFIAGLVVFEAERRHILLATPTKNLHHLGTEATGGARCIDRRVARPDDDNAAPDGDVSTGFIPCDELQGVHDRRIVFAGDTKFVHRPEAHAKKNKVVFKFERGKGIDANALAEAELDAEVSDHFDFAETVPGAELVLSYTVCVEAAG